ncbi:D-alanine--D-alanine ligase family protein [Nitrospira sp. Kam-Ns4a]
MKSLRVLVLLHPDLMPPESLEGYTEKEIFTWKTEYDVVTGLRKLGHDVLPLGVRDELTPIRTAITDWKPHIVFNLLEEFDGLAEFDQHVVSYLELLHVRYTGCNPRGLVLARDKALSKKLVVYHRTRVPAFTVFHKGRKVRRPKGLEFPLIVKSRSEEASLGIAQASVVDNDEKLAERVAFVHESIGTDAIVEQFIEGRELYVGVLGNNHLQVLPVWELVIEKLPPGSTPIATARVKHSLDYQAKHGIFQQPADGLTPSQVAFINNTTRRIARVLELDGYARIDYRLSPDGRLYFLEANPNPEIAEREEFASAAKAAGFTYPTLLQRILELGLARRR